MDKVTAEIVKQIDEVLTEWEVWNESGWQDAITLRLYGVRISQLYTKILDSIIRFAPPNSSYLLHSQQYFELLKGGSTISSLIPNYANHEIIDPLIGILEALKEGYIKGYLTSITELINAELFSDFLEIADYYLKENHKDAAAVMLGGVLEEHLRKLGNKNNVLITFQNAQGTTVPKKADTLNTDLTKAGVYNIGYQKQITAWLDIRNNAAHGNYGNYTKDQVQNMLEGMRIFINAYPA